MKSTDKTSFAPFILIQSDNPSLILSDQFMPLKFHIFEEKANQGWTGNGYDWTSIAKVLIDKQTPELRGKVKFDPESGMFSAIGPLEVLQQLGKALRNIFEDDNLLRDLLNRAKIN